MRHQTRKKNSYKDVKHLSMLSEPFSYAHKIITVLLSDMTRLETRCEYTAGKMKKKRKGGKKAKNNAYTHTLSSCKKSFASLA